MTTASRAISGAARDVPVRDVPARGVPARGVKRFATAVALLGLTVIGLGMSSVACGSASPPRIEQGQTISTGNAEFDAYFKKVLDTRAEADKAEKDVTEARAVLVKALELPADSNADATVREASESAKRLREGGVLLHLDLTPETKLISVQKKAPDPKVEAVLKGVEESAKSSLALVQRLRDLATRSDDLQKKRRELRDKTKETFGANAEDINRELYASEEVIDRAAKLSVKHAGLASQFVLALAGAVETGAAAVKGPARVAGRAPPKGKVSGKPSGKSGGPTSPASTPAPKKPKPKGGDDFEP